MCTIDSTAGGLTTERPSHKRLAAILAARADMAKILELVIAAMVGTEGVTMPPGLPRAAEGMYDGTMALTHDALDDLASTLQAAVAYYDAEALALEGEASSC